MTEEPSMAYLRAQAKERGITLPRGAKKNEIATLLSGEADQPNTPPPSPDPEPASPEVDPPGREEGQRVKIVRETDRAWTCPICGHATMHGTLTGAEESCAKCGAERDGSEVIVSSHG